MNELVFHPYIGDLLAQTMRRGWPSLDGLSPAQARAARDPFFAEVLGSPVPVAQALDLSIPRGDYLLPARLYRPRPARELPCLVYFHGGGWMLGSVASHDSLCRKLCLASGGAVLSVDYRLSPEHKYPVAVEDAYAAVAFAASHAAELGLAPGRLAVGGDSSGGNLAAVACLMARERGGPALDLQLLLYPPTDLSNFATPSYEKYGERLLLTREGMRFFARGYLREPAQAGEAYVSPGLAPDLGGLPPALVITAEHDVLASDGESYARRLREAGGSARHSCYRGMIHLFFGMQGLSEAENGLAEAAAALREAWSL